MKNIHWQIFPFIRRHFSHVISGLSIQALCTNLMAK